MLVDLDLDHSDDIDLALVGRDLHKHTNVKCYSHVDMATRYAEALRVHGVHYERVGVLLLVIFGMRNLARLRARTKETKGAWRRQGRRGADGEKQKENPTQTDVHIMSDI